ncbi:MAG: NAD-binding protein [Candidatus Micrarchaeota archaeon]
MGKVLIFGAGKVGRTLLEILEGQRHKTCVVEQDRSICEDLASQKSITIINGDTTDPKVLDDLELGSMDYVFAVTGSEEANFLSSVYAKQAGAKEIICRVDSIKHAKLLEKLGIEAVVSEFTLAAELANRIASPSIYKLLNPAESKLELVEKEAEKGDLEKAIKDYEKGKNFHVVALYNDGKYRLAKQTEKIKEGDRLIILRENGFKLF